MTAAAGGSCRTPSLSAGSPEASQTRGSFGRATSPSPKVLEHSDTGDKVKCPLCHRGMDHWKARQRQQVGNGRPHALSTAAVGRSYVVMPRRGVSVMYFHEDDNRAAARPSPCSRLCLWLLRCRPTWHRCFDQTKQINEATTIQYRPVRAAMHSVRTWTCLMTLLCLVRQQPSPVLFVYRCLTPLRPRVHTLVGTKSNHLCSTFTAVF